MRNVIRSDLLNRKKFTVDDLCLEYLSQFDLFDSIKEEFSDFNLIAFTISNFKNQENLRTSLRFRKWFEKHKDWVEIAVHSYDHQYPPDGDRENEAEWIEKALNELREFLPTQYGYRSPGWQTTNRTISILTNLGFSYIAYEQSIKYFARGSFPVVNSHLYDINSINSLYEILQNQVR